MKPYPKVEYISYDSTDQTLPQSYAQILWFYWPNLTPKLCTNPMIPHLAFFCTLYSSMTAFWFCYNNNNNNNNNNHHPPLKYNIQQSVLLSKYFSFSQFNTVIPLMYGQSDQRLPFLLSISQIIWDNKILLSTIPIFINYYPECNNY